MAHSGAFHIPLLEKKKKKRKEKKEKKRKKKALKKYVHFCVYTLLCI